MLWGLGNWKQVPAAGIVWACLFLACGYFIGKHADGGANTEVQKQLADLQSELAATRQTVALSMLQQQSASQRLEGVSWTTRLPEPDTKVLGALMHTVRFDNNVDVRLAALDALSRYADRPEVRRELVDVLQTTQSPMVQVALIDLLVDLHDKSAVPQFRKFQQDPNINPTVKKRVDWGIQQLN
jgi:HEAT repeat protein